MKLINDTPIETHELNGVEVLVKREDLSCPSPGPPFSKVRGLMAELELLKSNGYKTIGYTETSISMAGWGVAWGCQELNLQAVIFDPVYKKTPPLLRYHRKQWKKFGACILPIKAGMARVNWNISKNRLKELYPMDSILLPLGLPFHHSIDATAEEGRLSLFHPGVDKARTVVVNVGSGTITAGVLKAFLPDKVVIGVMGRTGNTERKRKQILAKAGIITGKLIDNGSNFHLVDPGWEYTEKSTTSCPFPCHPYYDLKAWQWLKENIDNLEKPILFWNIGRIK